MAVKKNLGIGLDVLLTATQGQYEKKSEENILAQAEALFGRALEEDKMGDSFEAYYLYRQVVDLLDTPESSLPELSELVSRSLNNIAVILADNSRIEEALSFLQQALEVYPQNQTAVENMKLILNS
ncbi:MAG: tetratricopeptide repeat protein [Syntrophomonadaceae bacterium]|nr:tetratricopeptide repeat protein [Syntrophomonadaceae bacterium]